MRRAEEADEAGSSPLSSPARGTPDTTGADAVGAAPSAPAITDEIAALNEELETINQLKTAKLLRLRVEAARKELETMGNEPTPATTSTTVGRTLPGDGTALRGSRPAPSDSDEDSEGHPSSPKRSRSRAHIDYQKPEKYRGENRQAFVEWTRACEQVFDIRHHLYRNDQDKIKMARGYLGGAPQRAWYRVRDAGDTANMTWDDFKKLLENDLKPATLRDVDVRRAYYCAAQGPNQRVHSFANYLEELEDQMEPFTDKQRCERLFFGLRENITKQILDKRATLTHRNQLLELAILVEETSDRTRPDRGIVPRRQGPMVRNRGRFAGPTLGSANETPVALRPKNPPRTSGPFDKSKIECYYCHKMGHFESECNQKKTDVGGGTRKGDSKDLNLALAVLRQSDKGAGNHLSVHAQLQGPRGWTTHRALIDSGATLNFVAQICAKELDLPSLGHSSGRIRTLGGEALQTFDTHTIRVAIEDHYGTKASVAQDFVAAAMVGYDLVLGMPWLREQDPDIDWSQGTFRVRRSRQSHLPPAPIETLSAAAFATILRDESSTLRCLTVTPTDTGAVAGQSLMASLEVEIPTEYHEYREAFSKEAAEELPQHGPQDHTIETAGRTPGFGPLYNLSATELAVLREYIDENLAKGFIRPSTSPAGAPILFVKKKDGTLRLCVDYRALNRVTVKNRYPLPLISEALDRLGGAKIFTKLDIRSAYNLIRIKEGQEWLTAFRTRYGHFEYRVMPFGLANAPATFQSYINWVLRDYLDVFCLAYLDDILVYSEDPVAHTDHVRAVLQRLQTHKLYAKLEKCEFGVTTVGFLGFVISPSGVSMEEARVASVRDWPVPASHRDVQVFLGFANFYRRFIHRFSKIARGLSDLLKGTKEGKAKGPFQLTPQGRSSFERLKEAFTTAPVLAHYDPNQPIQVETDASGFAIAGVLKQPGPNREQAHWHPVAFWSRKMTPAERNYGVGDMEMLAIVMAFKQWRHYLEGVPHTVRVVTDHANLRSFMSTKDLSRRQARWWEIMSGYSFEITYRPGKANAADPPSRRADYEPLEEMQDRNLPNQGEALMGTMGGAEALEEPRVATLPVPFRVVTASERENLVLAATQEGPYHEPTTSFHEAVARTQRTDAEAGRIRAAYLSGSGGSSTSSPAKEKARQDWSANSEGTIFFKGKLYIPELGGGRLDLLHRMHDDPLAGHFGYSRTLEITRRNYYWPHMAKDIKEYVATCTQCQRIKPLRHKPYGSLQTLPQPRGPWLDLTMDFITDLPPSKRRGKAYDCILVVVDRYTKMAHYIPVKKTIDAPTLADVFISKIVRIHGVPESIVSDRGSIFTSRFWSALCFHLNIRRRLSTAFHPQTDGQTERQNQTLEQYLRGYVNYQQDDWARLLPMAEFAYNNSRHASTGVSPFFAYTGTHPSMGVNTQEGPIDIPSAQERIQGLDRTRKEMSSFWQKTVADQARYHNKSTKDRSYSVGDLVWLAGKNIRTVRPNRKLDYKFHGPFRITDAIGKQAYKLELPKTMQVHPVFHVSLLEPYSPRDSDGDASPKPLEVDGEEEWEVAEVLDCRRRYGKLQYLVRWTGFSDQFNEWLCKDDLHADDLIQSFHEKYRSKPGDK